MCERHRRLLLGLACLLLARPAQAADWPPLDPSVLKATQPRLDKAADAEVVLWDVRISDSSSSNSLTTLTEHHLRIKIFTERGRERFAAVELPYAQNARIRDVEGRTVAPNGTVTELRGRDVLEKTLVQVGRERLRAKTFVLPAVVPGSVIDYRWREFEDDVLANNLELVMQRDLPVYEVRYHVKPLALDDIGYRMNTVAFNSTATPQLTQEGNGWTMLAFRDVPAVRTEPYMPPALAVKPWMLLFYADQTLVNRSEADFWREYGKRMYDDLALRMTSSPLVAEAVREIRAGSATPVAPEAIVRYVRGRIARTDTDTAKPGGRRENKTVGDALKNRAGRGIDQNLAFVQIATEAGLTASPVLLADRGQMFSTPAMKQPYFMSRMAAAVKTGEGWRFFDVANEHAADGLLPWENDGQPGLLLTKGSSSFVPVPISPARLTGRVRTARMTLLDSGALEGTVSLSYTGHLATQFRERDDDATPADRSRLLKEEFERQWAGTTIGDVTVEHLDDPQQPYVVSFTMQVPAFAERLGDRLLVRPGVLQRGIPAMFPEPTRTHSIVFPFLWSDEDRVTIALPTGFAVDTAEALPSMKEGNATLSYAAGVTVDAATNALVWSRRLDVSGQGFAAADYKGVKAFFDRVHERDQSTVVLRRTPAP